MTSNSDRPSRRASSDAVSPSRMRVTEQILTHLRTQIEQGKLKPGDSLPSSRHLAEEFGVSLNTVQKAIWRLHGMGLVKSSPRRPGVVTDLGRRQSRGRGGSEGLVLMFSEPGAEYTDFTSSWGSQILFAIENALSHESITLAKIYVPTVDAKVHPAIDGKIPDRELEKIAKLLESASAVIWLASAGLQPLILDAAGRGLPCVTINAPTDVIGYNLVKADNVAGGRTVGQVFTRLGYHRCLLLTRGIRYRRFAPELVEGFVDSFLKAGIPLRGIDYHDLQLDLVDEAASAVEHYLRHNPPPQGIFAVNDFLAEGAMQALQAAGLRIPEDVGLVSGTGLSPSCLQTKPTLSAWRQPIQGIADAASDMLLRLMDRPKDRLPPVFVGSSLILRGSLPRHDELIDLSGIDVDAPTPQPPRLG